MDGLQAMLQMTVAGVSMQAMLLALTAIVAGLVLGRIAEWGLRRVTAKTPHQSIRRAILEAFDRPVGWTLRIGGVGLGLTALTRGNVEAFDLQELVWHLLQAATIVMATWLGVRIIDGVSGLLAKRAGETEGTYDDQLVPILRKATKVFLVVTGAVMVIQNLGYSVSSLLAGVGIGGAALAFASRDTVANFFGSVVVFVDRPFVIGDWVEVGDVEGTVEVVGIRVTRIRTFSNSLITVPNALFTTTAINNWSKMRKRRLKLTFGLTYDSPPEKLRQAVTAIREIITSEDRLDHEFFLVNFFELGPSSLDIYCYVFTRTTNWVEHMQVREDFLFKVMDAVGQLGLEFAFPTQTVHLADPQGANVGADSERAGPQRVPHRAPPAMQRDSPR